ncbi:Mobile element protein [Bathymodiolus brooksi thiotrophic gill symbiont]|nr:Mobile element protein [Bathymodiolus brooksi thiotrophic gill symbiont]SHE22746.1 Mobile element protein [Bathymodiolus brooksi thiotrophic gill symbiont]
MKITLTSEQKKALELRHNKVRDVHECDRIKAILLSSEGWSITQIAQALRKHDSTISRHLMDFKNKQKLAPENGGSQSLLKADQTEKLIQHLSEITDVHTHQIVAYVLSVYAIQYSLSGMNKWLHQQGFSYKQPKGVPHKFNAEKQAEFIREYEALKASLACDEPLLFIDAVPPTQATKVTSGWIKTGVDKVIETTGSRTRLNIIGAIRLGFLSEAIPHQYKTVNGESIIDFFEKIKAQYASSHCINIVLDGAGYHRSSVVVEKAKELNIKLHYLPPYSPNLNPIERLWKVMNEHARNNKYFATAKEFRHQINHFFDRTLPSIADSLNERINDNFQVLSSAS